MLWWLMVGELVHGQRLLVGVLLLLLLMIHRLLA
jgi:hypothetical protein